MSLISVRIRSVDAGQDLENRWAGWQARAAAIDSAKNRAVAMVAAAILLLVVLNGLLSLR